VVPPGGYQIFLPYSVVSLEIAFRISDVADMTIKVSKAQEALEDHQISLRSWVDSKAWVVLLVNSTRCYVLICTDSR
jgi:hypothetical protein